MRMSEGRQYRAVRAGFLIVFGLQLVLMYVIFDAVKRHMTADRYYIYLELVALTVFFDMAMAAIYMFQRRMQALKAQLEEQQFLTRMEEQHEQARKEMQQDVRQLHDGLTAELELARSAVKEMAVAAKAVQPDLTGPGTSEEWDHSICAHAIVNTVLREKISVCRKQEIPCTCQVRIPQGIQVSDYHLCSIFANLLDNAVEASLALPKSRRSISVQAEVRKKYLYIRIKNACIPEYAGRRRREGRGYGKEILEKLAAEYEGEMNVKVEDEMYVADLVLKVE